MFSLETIGYYSRDRDSQQYPGPLFFQRLYPDTGNFIGFVSNFASFARVVMGLAQMFRTLARG